MSIAKKSLLSTLKTTKKANLAKAEFSHAGSATPTVKSARPVMAKSTRTATVKTRSRTRC